MDEKDIFANLKDRVSYSPDSGLKVERDLIRYLVGCWVVCLFRSDFQPLPLNLCGKDVAGILKRRLFELCNCGVLDLELLFLSVLAAKLAKEEMPKVCDGDQLLVFYVGGQYEFCIPYELVDRILEFLYTELTR